MEFSTKRRYTFGQDNSRNGGSQIHTASCTELGKGKIAVLGAQGVSRALPKAISFLPAAAEGTSMLAKARGVTGLTTAGLATQTAVDTAIGAGKALYAGGGNPIKGYGITSKRLMDNIPDDASPNFHGVDIPSLNPFGSHASMDPITNTTALVRDINASRQSGLAADLGRAH